MSRPDEWTPDHDVMFESLETVIDELGYPQVELGDLFLTYLLQAKFLIVASKVLESPGELPHWVQDAYNNTVEQFIIMAIRTKREAEETDVHYWKEHIETMPQST